MAFRINHIHLKAPDDVRVELVERKKAISGGCC